jgi:VanZ family protein
LCTKVGHNKTTCPRLFRDVVREQKNEPKAPPASVHFFVHHVNAEPPASPHVVNLRPSSSAIWNKVNATGPKKSTNPRYHFYHEQALHPHFAPTRADQVSVNAVAKRAQRLFENPEAHPVVAPFTTEPKTLPTQTKKSVPVFETSTVSNALYTPPSSPLNIRKPKMEERARELAGHLEDIAYGIGKYFRSLFTQIPSKRSIAIALLVITVLGILPLPARSYFAELQKNKAAVVENGTAGFKDLESSTSQLLSAEVYGAQSATTDALAHFDIALTTLQKYRWLETVVKSLPVISDEFKSREKLLLAGQQITLGNSYLLAGLTTGTNASSTPLERINHILTTLPDALPNYQKALDNLNDVSPNVLPPEYQNSFEKFRSLFAAATSDLKSMNSLSGPINEIFGGQGFRRYLIVFQNPSEIRPTGGFIGSFAVLEVKDGKVTKLEVPPGGSYDLQGQLDEYLEPPTPLLLTNKRWEFQDANWFPDFKTSSEKLLWFYRHSRGVTLDGVIAINAPVLEELLTLTGPITDEKRNVTLASDSALDLIQNIVETGDEKKINKPKQIISDLAPELLKRFTTLSPTTTLPLLRNLENALNEKDIQLYFTDHAAEESVRSFGWSGQIPDTDNDQDYLSVINTNIGGQKSDARIEQTIQHEAVVSDDGSITDTVTITRTHQGKPEEKLYGAVNIDYLRVYVPENSTLLSASGFTWPDDTNFRAPESWYEKDNFLSEQEKLVGIDPSSGTHIVNEFGKTSFGNWIITRPGETTEVQFSYRLPFNIFSTATNHKSFLQSLFSLRDSVANYQLIVNRQSGQTSSFKSQAIFPTGWTPIWKNDNAISLASNGAEINVSTLEKDALWAFAMKKK